MLEKDFEKPDDSVKPEEITTRPKIGRKALSQADLVEESLKVSGIKASQNNLEDIEEDERNAGLVLDEAQFGKSNLVCENAS